ESLETFRFYLSGFSDFIQGSYDIMFAEFYAIYQGFSLAKDMEIEKLVCYSDSLMYCINLITGPNVKYHVHAMLIQDIKELLSNNKCFSLPHP
ncbi:replication protein A1-like protein, partial [Trifolium medium]|nr:replication protein A1-like protein [Trifolium medium]